MKKSIGIVVPFYNTPMWLQTSIYGLVTTVHKFKDQYDIQILVVDNTDDVLYRSYKKETINALKLVPELTDKVTIIKNPEKIRFHGTALDTAVRYFNTDYLLCWETDIAIFNDNWLDWVMSHIEDHNVWMAGYEFLDYNNSRDNIVWYVMPNPGIYRMDILKEINKEVEDNSDVTHRYGNNYSFSNNDTANHRYGVFSEKRGFKDIHPNCPDGKGMLARPNPYHYENGQWLFYRVMRDDRPFIYKVLQQYRHLENCNGETTPMYSEFGGGRFKHYWAGTRSWDFMTHPEANLSQINYVREKIKIEIEVWKQIVPEHIRKIVPEVYNSCRRDDWEYTNLRYIYDNKMGNVNSQALSLATANWYKKEFLDTNFQNLLK